MRETFTHFFNNYNKYDSNGELIIELQDDIFRIDEYALLEPIEDDFEYEILVDGSSPPSDGRHYLGYREGEDEDDKYFWPETGAHFEYSEVIRKLNKYKRKLKQKQEKPNIKPQLFINNELPKGSLDRDTKPKSDSKQPSIYGTYNSIGSIMSSIHQTKDFEMKSIESLDIMPKANNNFKENSYYDNAKVCRKNNNSQLAKLGNIYATEDLRKNIDIGILK